MKPFTLSLLAVTTILAAILLTVWLAEHFTAITLPFALIALPLTLAHEFKTEKEGSH